MAHHVTPIRGSAAAQAAHLAGKVSGAQWAPDGHDPCDGHDIRLLMIIGKKFLNISR
jgi:hypothetical protein